MDDYLVEHLGDDLVGRATDRIGTRYRFVPTRGSCQLDQAVRPRRSVRRRSEKQTTVGYLEQSDIRPGLLASDYVGPKSVPTGFYADFVIFIYDPRLCHNWL